jgi:hypothetical protein
MLHSQGWSLVYHAPVNAFDASWVRSQWKRIESLWIQHCEHDVGHVVGHASDGDSRRRMLMLQDYVSNVGDRFSINWAGWVMSAAFGSSGHINSLHDQDYIHNGKKLINLLDSPVRVLQLGGDVCC